MTVERWSAKRSTMAPSKDELEIHLQLAGSPDRQPFVRGTGARCAEDVRLTAANR